MSGLKQEAWLIAKLRGKFVQILIGAWIVFSVPFVAYQGWSHLEDAHYARGIQDGSRSAAVSIYNDLIQKASNSNCDTVFVQQGDQRVDLINVQCLRVIEGTRPQGAPAQPLASGPAEPPVAVPPSAGSTRIGEPGEEDGSGDD